MIFNYQETVKSILLKKLPFLGAYKRFLLSMLNSFTPIKSFCSQHGEDAFIKKELQSYGLNHSIYVDIGSNHPTCISNTYLFYRTGLHGVAIEANSELAKLHRHFRARDIVLNFGCGSEPSLGKFQIGKAPVLSHFYNYKQRKFQNN